MASSKEYLDFVLEQCSGLSACAINNYILFSIFLNEVSKIKLNTYI